MGSVMRAIGAFCARRRLLVVGTRLAAAIMIAVSSAGMVTAVEPEPPPSSEPDLPEEIEPPGDDPLESVPQPRRPSDRITPQR